MVRTMPEVALFRDEHVRRCMTDVLFVFMQKHPEVQYVQVRMMERDRVLELEGRMRDSRDRKSLCRIEVLICKKS